MRGIKRQCPKAYHSHCVEKNESFMTSEECWNCNWHSCFMCGRKAHFHCYCCPNALCRFCISAAEFCRVRGMNGFCNSCLKLAILIEENMDVDSDGEKVDFKDRETYEGLFMEYYKIVQEKERFKIDDIRAATDRKKTGNSDSDEFGNDEVVSEYEKEEDLKQHLSKKAFKGKLSWKHKNARSKIMQFTGWGSTSLIQFLQSIGKDTTEKLSERTVEAIIHRYIAEHKLFQPEKKRKIICDENLRSIFGRKFVNKNRIYELLEAHYSDNLEDSEEDEWEEEEMYFAVYKDKDASVACGTRRELKKKRESQKHDTELEKEKESEKHGTLLTAPQSHFASITAENIKLVYLRKSLVIELLKQPKSFKDKVTGSIIRVKSDPDDYRWTKNSHQLVQVTGIKETPTGENNNDMILCGSNMPLGIQISMLSDGDFSQEECNDLRQKVKDGLVQKLSVVELQEKARSLHEDITNHEISRELKILDGRIIQAIEKGRRQELFEHMERRNQLQTPSERLRLLEYHHAVIPEELEPVIEEIGHDQKGDEMSHESKFSINLNWKWGGNCTSRENKFHGPLSCQYEKQNLPEVSLSVSPNQSASKEEDNKMMASALEVSPEPSLACEDQCNMMLQADAELCSSSVEVTKQNLPEENNKAFEVSPGLSLASEDQRNGMLQTDAELCILTVEVTKQNLPGENNKAFEVSPGLSLASEDQCNGMLQTDAELCISTVEVTKQNLPEVSLSISPNQSAPKEENNKALEVSPEPSLASEDQCNVVLQTDAELCSSPVEVAMQNLPRASLSISPRQPASKEKNNKTVASAHEVSPRPSDTCEDGQNAMLQVETDAELDGSAVEVTKQNQGMDAEGATSKKTVIVVSSDDESTWSYEPRKQHLEDPYSREWLILGPNGERNEEKYSLSLLKRWSDASSYALKYKAWKENGSEELAIPLADAIKKAFMS
nr:zinc finger CCCH domain-containing protein 19-like isoform X2 [Coffea arabica]